jgi:hypothetical protein
MSISDWAREDRHHTEYRSNQQPMPPFYAGLIIAFQGSPQSSTQLELRELQVAQIAPGIIPR